MAKRYPAQLSGGQRQRVGVARALAADPPLLLMDEPFGAIDPITRGRLQEEFRRLQHELGKTVVFVTHDIDEALKLGDRIAVLKPGGVLAQFATPEELVRSPADEFVEEFVGADRMIARLEWLTAVRGGAPRVSLPPRPRHPRPGPDPRARQRQPVLRPGERLLPRLDRPPPRRLPLPAVAPRRADARLRRARLRHRLRARARRPPPPLAHRPDRRRHRHPLHDPVAGGSSRS